jgi:arylsulfatase A-like enzyme
MHKFGRLLATFFLGFFTGGLAVAGGASHVVVVVWDGMRPDFVTERNTPTLAELGRSGVIFSHHHPVYISSTEVNGTALATGVYPQQSGIIGNKEYRPTVEPLKSIMTADPKAVRKADGLSRGHFIGVTTLAETLHAHGLHTAVAGAKTVTLLQDRRADQSRGFGVDVFEGSVLPTSLAAKLRDALGPFPPVALPKLQRDRWTTTALLGPLWSNGVPAFSMLWLSEPDFSQHNTGPGSKVSLRALRSCDDNLARVLAALKQCGVAGQTDVIVVSDHGFSTIAHNIDVAAVLNQAGFKAQRKFSGTGPATGEVMVVGNGGTVFLYVVGHGPALVAKLVHFLQGQSFCGVLLTRDPVPGAFRLEQARINSPAAPDIVMSLRWTDARSRTGAPGLLDSDYSEYGPGQGMHASLSPFDLHNTCIAAGPDFRKGFQDALPTGNIDIAPTILHILGVPPAGKLAGRVLTEALVNSDAPAPKARSQRLEATWRGPSFIWRQHLTLSEVEGVRYLDEGNGSQEPLKTASK